MRVGGIGVEYREDELKSISDADSVLGFGWYKTSVFAEGNRSLDSEDWWE